MLKADEDDQGRLDKQPETEAYNIHVKHRAMKTLARIRIGGDRN
nr:hypothetical protein [Brevibacillus laterosporus]